MNSNSQLNALIELAEKFILLSNTLLEKGIIDQEAYIKMTENKINFLKINNVNVEFYK